MSTPRALTPTALATTARATTAALVVIACAGRGTADVSRIDGGRSAAAAASGAWSAGAVPRMLGEGVLSTPMNEFGGSLSPDGREIYFSISAERSYTYAIGVSRLVGGRWSEPEIAPFSSAGRNFDPVFSPDGRRIYFVSDRAPDGGLGKPPNPDLWVAERDSGGAWDAPRRLDISSPTATEWFASEARDGTLYVAAARPDMPGVDLFRSRRTGSTYSALEPVGAPLETRGLEAEPMIAPDGSFLVFAAYERPGGHGHFDLWISHRRGDGWSDPVNLGPAVNGPARDYSPRLAPDGRTLLFTSERHFRLASPGTPLTTEALDAGLRGALNGSGNMYAVDLRALGMLPGDSTQTPGGTAAAGPRLVGPRTVSTSDYERGATVTPDGGTMFFTRRLPNGYGSFVMESRRVDGRWGEPRVAPFSGRHVDLDPFVTPDGGRLLFVSDRPWPGDSAAGDLDVWVAERAGDGWGAPRPLEGAVNGPGDENFPTVDREGTLYFSASRAGGAGLDIYRARRGAGGYLAPERLDSAVNSPFPDTHPAISPDGRVLVFASVGRADEAVQEGARYPRGDLYASERVGDRWSRARRLGGGVNTAAAELSPVFSPDGRTLRFTSERGFALAPPASALDRQALIRGLGAVENGLGNIYEIDVAALGLRGAGVERESNGDVVLDGADSLRAQPAPVASILGEGTVSTGANEFGGAMSPDGRELYFAVSVPRSYLYAICVSRRVGDRWSEPEVLPFSGRFRDFDPVLTPDGRRMFFVSDRGDAGAGGARARDYDLWFTDRGGDGRWSAPRRLGAPITRSSDDGRANEWFASATADGTLFFAAERPGGRGGADIWMARREGDGYAPPEPLGEAINTPGWESEPSVAPDGSFLVFSALGRRDGHGGWDIYISHRTADGWSAPRNLGPAVNTSARDYSPRLADGGRTLVFTSERHFLTAGPPARALDAADLTRRLRGTGNGHGDLYTIDLRALGAAR